jgi:hypothetical protein
MQRPSPGDSSHGARRKRHRNQRRAPDVFGQLILIVGALVQLALVAVGAFYLMKWIMRAF